MRTALILGQVCVAPNQCECCSGYKGINCTLGIMVHDENLIIIIVIIMFALINRC